MSTVVDMRENAGLSWFNCYTFGDGLESDRIRDSFNEMQLSNGAKASATLEEPFAEEVRKYGLIYSGIYNSNSGVNNLNQFIAAEKITKDLNPTYGSIQKLFTRDTDLITLCEDKVLKILANKDALFNADGNPQLVSNSKVLGQSIPFVGDYGISKNPESFAADNFRAYFADKQRRSVLRLSRDGLTPISDYGMRDWFIDHLDTNINILGSYDDFSDQYNITLSPQQQPNLILNNTLQEGTLSEIFSTFGDVVLNGSFGSGTALNADMSLLEQSQNQLLAHSDFDMSSTVTYHPLIPVGDIIPESGGDPIPLVVTGDSFVVGSPSYNDAAVNSEAKVSGVPLVYQTLFRSYGQALSTAQTSGPLFGFRLQDHYGNWTTPRYTGKIEFDPPGQPYNPWGGNIFPYFTYIPDIANIDDDNQFYILERNYYHPSFPDYGTDNGLVVSKLASPDSKYYIWPNYEYNSTFFGTNPPIDNNVPSGIFNDPDYQDIGIKNNTIFYGEEVLISFKAAHPYGQSNASSETNPFAKFKIKIYDGFTEIPDNLLYGPVDTPGNDYLSRHMEEGFPPGNFHHLGYRTVNENTFGNPVTDMRQFSILYKFTNPEDREASGIAVNDLKVRLELSFGNTNGQPVTIQSFKIEKVFHLHERLTEGGGTTPYIAPVPEVEIPAWFEVAHTPFEGWTSNVENATSFSGVNLLGNPNPGTAIQYGEGENDFYLTGTTNSQIPNSILAEVAQNYFQNGGATIYNFNGPDATAKLNTSNIFVNGEPTGDINSKQLSTNVSIEQGRTYLLDLGYDIGQLASSTINASPTDLIGLKLSNINGGVDFELSSRDYTTPSTILRAQFTADADYENITIAPDVLEHPYEVIIQNASLIDITSSSSGGTASNWNIPLSAYFTDTILESPEVYYDGSKIIFNTTQIEDRSVTQSLSNNLTLTSSVDGWNFTFDAEVTQGSLSGYVSNGENLGFEFSGLEESGTYVINGNFNTGYAVTATKDGQTYPLTVSTISAASNTDPLSIVFQPETEVFVGSLDNVKLENQTQYLGSVSSANDFVISDTFNPAINNYITWEDEKINFNYAPDNAFIYQNIGVLQEGDTYKITLEGVAFNEGTDDKIRVYYRSENNLGFEFTFTANGFEERQKTISFSEVEFDFPDNALVIAPASGAVFNGTVDNIVVQRYLDDEPEYTISYSEKANGWVSFKSFIPESALSLSGSYYTFKEGKPYKHNSNEYRGVFYHDGGNVIPTNEASVTFILNEAASSVKSFKTLNYEGTEGWENEYVTTDMESGYVSHFIEKEGKWFNYVHGGAKGFTQPVLNTSDFNFQGLGTTVTE